jgi:hypothetical protein
VCADHLPAPHRGSRRAAGDASRWAGGFLWLLLQSDSSRPAASCSACERVCCSHNPVLHPQPSAHPRVPAFHRVFLTRSTHASPPFHVALRPRLHGLARLILAVLGRVEGTARGIAADVCRPRSVHPGRSAQHSLQPTALSGRFSTSSCADRSWRLTPLYSSGGRLSFSVGRQPGSACCC